MELLDILTNDEVVRLRPMMVFCAASRSRGHDQIVVRDWRRKLKDGTGGHTSSYDLYVKLYLSRLLAHNDEFDEHDT
jgi:hypothetical protein